jgi:hypothetical protein
MKAGAGMASIGGFAALSHAPLAKPWQGGELSPLAARDWRC